MPHKVAANIGGVRTEMAMMVTFSRVDDGVASQQELVLRSTERFATGIAC